MRAPCSSHPQPALMIETVGGLLAGAATVIVTGWDVAVAPALSVATAVRLYVPAATLLHVTL